VSGLPLIQGKESVSVPVVVEFLKKTVCTWSVSPGCKAAAPGGIPWTKLCGLSPVTSAPCLKLATRMVILSCTPPERGSLSSLHLVSLRMKYKPKLDNQLPL
jgi:hypothetical protein